MPVYCDAYALTVTLPDADQQFYLTHKATLTIDYTWTSAGPDDMDLFAFAPDGSLYVAYTYDGGQTWTTVDATPGNPIQRGCIWNGGGSNACRNLLDFNDASIDKQGRVLVAYTDGCANINYSYSTLVGGVQGLKHGPSQCNTDPSAYKDTDKVGFDGLVRQSCGQGLLRSADPGFTSGCPAPRVVSVHPLPNATGVAVTTTVTATFDAPLTSANITLADSGGRAVKGRVSCNSPCTTVTFAPSSRLRKGTAYTAKATGSNASGQGATTWTFTTK